MNINFYQTNDIAHATIAPILTKILEDDKKALIYCQDQNLLNQINDGLWNFSKTKFIPHSTKDDEIEAAKQPIFLSLEQENINDAHYLIIFDKIEDDFAKKFQKVFYFFNDSSLKQSKDLWRYYKTQSANLNFYKKEQGKWVVSG